MSANKWKPKDVPQADDLSTVRVVVAAVESVGPRASDVAEETEYSERHVRYRLQAAVVLGLIDEAHEIAKRGRALLDTEPGSDFERDAFMHAITESPSLRDIVPGLMDAERPPIDSIKESIQEKTGMSASTASRRARALRSWRRQVLSDR